MLEQGAKAIDRLIAEGEGKQVEFKSTLRTDLRKGKKDRNIENAVLKTLAAFLNTDGGTLLIGVGDDGSVLGVAADGFNSEDKMLLHLKNLVNRSLGAEQRRTIDAGFEDSAGKRVLRVDCDATSRPVYCRFTGETEKFFIRAGPTTEELGPEALVSYVLERFPRIAVNTPHEETRYSDDSG